MGNNIKSYSSHTLNSRNNLQDFLLAIYQHCATSTNRPVASFFQMDSTSTNVTHKFSFAAIGRRTLKREGGEHSKFNVMHSFLQKCNPLGENEQASRTSEPTPVTSDAHWHLVATFRVWQVLLPEIRKYPTSISTSGYCFDGGIYIGCMSKIRAVHRECIEAHGVSDDDRYKRFLNDVIVSVLCGAHTCHNSLTWGIHWMLGISPASKMDGIWVITASLRDCYAELIDALPQLQVHLEFTDREFLSHEDRLLLWQLLAVDDDIAQMAADLGIHWANGKLYVLGRWDGYAELFNNIIWVAAGVLKIQQHKSARRVTLGQTMGTLIAGVLIGLDRLVALAFARKHSDWRLKGYQRFTEDLRCRVVHIGFANTKTTIYIVYLRSEICTCPWFMLQFRVCINVYA